MAWRCDLFLGYEEIGRMAGASEGATMGMKKNVHSWFGHVEQMSDEKKAKKTGKKEAG